MTALRVRVREFMRGIGQQVLDTPTTPDDKTARLRARLVVEEAFEFAEALLDPGGFVELKERALALIASAPVHVDLPGAADALADLDYVVEGSRLAFGINGAPIAAVVHAANMAKLTGHTDEHGKRLKPPGWAPPDIEGELRQQGWKSR